MLLSIEVADPFYKTNDGFYAGWSCTYAMFLGPRLDEAFDTQSSFCTIEFKQIRCLPAVTFCMVENTDLCAGPVCWLHRQLPGSICIAQRHIRDSFANSFPDFHVLLNYPLQQDHSWTCAVRIGEAKNPGPLCTWRLQLRNIVSAVAHIDEFKDASDECLLWTETSATAMTLASFHTLAKNARRSLITSPPSGARHLKGVMTSGRGEASGVMISSKYRATDLKQLWSPAIYQTGRVADCLIQIGEIQVRVLALYGYHSNMANSLGLNEILFQEVLDQASAYQLPTIIAGDFNYSITEAPIWSQFQASGFVDLATRFASLAGQSPQPTYRGKTRIDFVLVNSHAERMVKSFMQDPRGFTDHASLHVDFNVPRHSPLSYQWQMPVDIASVPQVLDKLPQQDLQPQHASLFCKHIQDCNMDQAFQTFALAFEDACCHVHQALGLGVLPAKYKGRSKGKLLRRQPRHFTLSATGVVLSEQVQFRLRQKAIRRLRELIWSLHKEGTFSAGHQRMWTALQRSQGFPSGFSSWILLNDLVDWVPQQPSLAWLRDLLQKLLCEEVLWSQAVKSRQQSLRKASMDVDWQSGGSWHAQRVKPPSAASLNSLASTTTLRVEPIRTVKGASATFNVRFGPLPSPGAVWNFGNIKVPVKRVEGITVTLGRPFNSCMWRREVVQREWCSDPAFVASEIATFWRSFWHQTAQPSPGSVQEAVNFLPQLDEFDVAITPQDLDWVLRRLPRKKARGLDGFSYAELRSLGPDFKSALLLLLNTITISGTWPSQLCDATVALLAKVDDPQVAAHGRPITILATVYRVWSKCYTYKVLKHFLPCIPDTLFGSVPGRSSLDTAWILQSAIEVALIKGEKLSGTTMDLSKAYNLIPRRPLQTICARLGWPLALRRSYDAFLSKLQRFFCVGDSLYGPHDSSVGVPEGCPLAVTAMMAVSWMADARQRALCNIPLYSYVDNWSIQHSSETELLHAVQVTEQTVTSLAMVLAMDKLKFYSTDSKSRQLLRSSTLNETNLVVVNDFQDLGVYFASIKRQSAKGFNQRFVHNQSRFQKLQVVQWSDFRRAKTLVRVVLPAVLYGAELTHISWSGYKMLRGRCSSCMWGGHSHREHFLTPVLSASEIYEPFILVFLKRWRTTQRMLRRYSDLAFSRWNEVMNSAQNELLGPLSYFFEQLHQMHWTPLFDGMVRDHHGISWSVRDACVPEIRQVVCDGWVAAICKDVRQDDQFAGLQAFHVCRSRQVLQPSASQYNTQQANYVVGAIMSTATKSKFLESQSAMCNLCGQEGDARHVLYHCGATRHVRDELDLRGLDSLPDFIKVSGLFPVVSEYSEFLLHLASVRDEQHYPCMPDTIHVFTDGSTDYGNTPGLALSSWSVILAEVEKQEPAVVASGILPGVTQSNNRAELYAIYQAVLTIRDGFLYTDSLYCLTGLWKLQQHGWIESEWSSCHHYDIWLRLAKLLQDNPARWEFVKVKSHQKHAPHHTAWDSWIIWHNDAADQAAKDANKNRSQSFLQMHARLLEGWRAEYRQRKVLAELQTKVSLFSKQARVAVTPPPLPIQDRFQLQMERLGMQGNDLSRSVPAANPNPDLQYFVLHAPFAALLRDFLLDQKWVPDPDGFSICELYIFFTAATGWLVPINICGMANDLRPPALRSSSAQACWAHETDWSHLKLLRQPLNVQCRTFLFVLRELFRYLRLPWEITLRRCLHFVGHSFPVQSLPFRPLATCDGHVIRRIQQLQGGGSFVASLTKIFSVMHDPVPATRSLRNFDLIWNRRKAYSR